MREPPEWSQTGLRWIARLSAATAAVLFGLVLLAIHQEHRLHDSTADIVATFRLNNAYFDQRVQFPQATRIRDTATALTATLDQVSSTATEDVRLLAATLPDTTRLSAAALGDLSLARELTGIAGDLRDTAGDILLTAHHADGTVSTASRRLASIADLVARLNGHLAEIDRKLPLPATGPSNDHHPTHASPTEAGPSR